MVVNLFGLLLHYYVLQWDYIFVLCYRIGCGSAWHSGTLSGVLEETLLVQPQRTGLGRMAQIPWPWLREEVWELPDLLS